jgi:DNA-binding MarR family transcriptional regulator
VNPRRHTPRAPAARPAPSVLPIDSSLFFKLVRVVNLTARPFVETLSKTHQLSLNEWRVMIVLANHPGVAAHDVVDMTGLDKMSVSRALGSLGRHRRLTKKPDQADARRTLLWLNAAGLKLYRTIGTPAAARESQFFGGVTAAEIGQLGQTIDKLIRALSEPEQA